jgi:hypothetical protein
MMSQECQKRKSDEMATCHYNGDTLPKRESYPIIVQPQNSVKVARTAAERRNSLRYLVPAALAIQDQKRIRWQTDA